MPLSTRNLSILRFYYLLLGIGGGFLSPFISLFYKQQGLSGTQIGLLATFAGMAALLAAPLWGRLSDAAARPRCWPASRTSAFAARCVTCCIAGACAAWPSRWLSLVS